MVGERTLNLDEGKAAAGTLVECWVRLEKTRRRQPVAGLVASWVGAYVRHHGSRHAVTGGISEQKHDVSKRQDTRPRTWEKGQGRMALQRGELRMKIRSIPKVRLRNRTESASWESVTACRNGMSMTDA